jgi:3'-phosphoadenosine 5'-phosphosulfate sulfotransferase (PAPS reductase)/FAD synthetase
MENNEMKSCSRCLAHEGLPGISVDKDGECNLCKSYTPYEPKDPVTLHRIIARAKRKGRTYDALVPVSGGKDSAYVLYLAVRKYNLKVLTYTFDNGFMSPLAIDNIRRITESCGVDHVWVRHNPAMLKKLYSGTAAMSPRR